MKRFVTAAAVTVVLAVPPSAAAKLDAGDLKNAQLRTKTFLPFTGDFGDPAPPPGGYVKCPKGTRVLTGGAYVHDPGEGPSTPGPGEFEPIGASAPTKNGKRWYAAGVELTAPKRVTVAVRCLPKRKLSAVESKVAELNPASGEAIGKTLRCSRGMEALTGGALWHRPGERPVPEEAGKGLLASSTVTANGRAWYADGTDNFLIEEERLRVVVRCVPKAELAGTSTKERTIEDVPDDGIAGATVRCRKGRRALTGGGFWHASGSGPDPAGNAGIFGGSNSFSRNGKSWHAHGLNFNAGGTGGIRSFTVRAICLKG